MDSPPIGLSEDELHFVTGYRYPKKQIQALVLMEIPFKVRPDGSPFVARAAVVPEQATPRETKKTAWKINM